MSTNENRRQISLLDLNSDVLYIIFSLLDRRTLIKLAQVSKKLRDSTYSTSFWRQTIATFDCAELDIQTVKSLKNRGIKAIRLQGRGAHQEPPAVVSALTNCANTGHTELLILSSLC